MTCDCVGVGVVVFDLQKVPRDIFLGFFLFAESDVGLSVVLDLYCSDDGLGIGNSAVPDEGDMIVGEETILGIGFGEGEGICWIVWDGIVLSVLP